MSACLIKSSLVAAGFIINDEQKLSVAKRGGRTRLRCGVHVYTGTSRGSSYRRVDAELYYVLYMQLQLAPGLILLLVYAAVTSI